MSGQTEILWTAKDAEKATEGKAGGDWVATGVSIDSRTVSKGDLFIAIKGDQFDGHDFVKHALDNGAVAAVISKKPEGVDDGRLLVVADTFKAMQDLGRAARHRAGAKIVGVTGSVGKTGTKEMLVAAFCGLGQTHASSKSYNNHWGVPLSLSQMSPGCDFGIFEMGMNHSGELMPLSQMVQPHVTIITTVAPVHMEHFSSEQEIADAKAEIFEGVEPGGTAVLNRDNEWFAHLKAKAQTKGLDVIGFGESSDSEVCLLYCLEAANGSRIKARVIDEEISFSLQIPGRHIVMNALAVLAAVKILDGDIRTAAKALERLQPIAGRGLREYLALGLPDNPVTLIDESYNASPVAMRAAFKVLALIDPGRGGRRIAVLGDMLELGKDAAKQHAELALPLQAADVQLVYTCGSLMKNLYDALPEDRRGAHRTNSVELSQIVPDVLTPGDVVMVKGSNGSKMGTVVEALRALPEKFNKTGQREKV